MRAQQIWATAGQHRRTAVAGAAAALLVVAVFLYGLASMISAGWRLVFAGPPGPDVLTQVQRHDSSASLVALFAEHCTKAWIQSTPETLGQLRQCVTVPADARNSSGMAAEVSDVAVYAPQLSYRTSKLTLWSVLVDATVKEFGAPAATRQFISWSIAVPDGGGPRAIIMPSVRATGLPPGVDLELAYTHQLRAPEAKDAAPSSSLYEVVRRFIQGYLSGSDNDIAGYITASSNLSSLGRLYSVVTVDSVLADTAVAGAPRPGQTVRVLLTVTGRDNTGGQKSMQYPLSVAEAGGKWAVAAIEDVPAATGRILSPGK